MMRVELLAITQPLNGGTPEELLEHAGRVCYRSQGESDSFLQDRIKMGHESIIEHAVATFEISGISRACSHQLVRHRLASYSQESQRFVAMDEPEFVAPKSIAKCDETYMIWRIVMGQIEAAYRSLRDWGIPKEDARFVLPNATATRIIVTMNFRTLRHFFKVRCTENAQWEIREMAKMMLRLVYEQAPVVFGDLLEKFADYRCSSTDLVLER